MARETGASSPSSTTRAPAVSTPQPTSPATVSPNVKALLGGIDAWSQQIDSTLPRYTLE